MKKSNSTWNDILKPIVVLTVICLVVSALLGATNGVTAPIIEKNAALAADAARIELLPEATDGFTKVDCDMEGIVEMYKANNDTGYVITSTAKGYGGAINFMSSYNMDGAIVNLKVLSCAETPGLGKKIEERNFLDQFMGKAEELSKANVDVITGSTISSMASIEALNYAHAAFNKVAKGVVVVEKTLEEKLGELYGEGKAPATLTTDYTHADAVAFYKAEGGVIVCSQGKGNGIIGDEHLSGEYLKAYVAFNADGTVAGVYFDDTSETKGLGTKISEPEFIANFIGKSTVDGIDVIAGTTYSSKGAIEAVGKAIAVYAAVM
ncbi:MAG: FMN-binding protein [Oscillospiraceae bacterium]